MTAPFVEDCVRQCLFTHVGDPDDAAIFAFPMSAQTWRVSVYVRGQKIFGVEGEDPETVLDFLENNARKVGEAMRQARKTRRGVA